MPYWSTNKVEDVQKKRPLVEPFNIERVKQGAYELSMGSQGAISSDGSNRIIELKPRQEFCVPEGQFGLLLTEERVTIPHNVLAFISLKTSFKSQGLINVSGFHVDPGYDGKLKFWVYNAGNQPVTILRGDAAFLIWFADMDQSTRDAKATPGHCEITAADLRNLQGHLASPAELAKEIKQLKHDVKLLEFTVTTAVVIVIGLCIALATPLLDYIIKPVIERFHNDSPSASVVVVPVPPAGDSANVIQSTAQQSAHPASLGDQSAVSSSSVAPKPAVESKPVAPAPIVGNAKEEAPPPGGKP